MKYYLLPKAEADLAEILEYLGYHSPAAALKLAHKLRDRWEMLGESLLRANP